MRQTITVNLGNLVLSLSDAMDLASPLLNQHQQRTAYMIWQMGIISQMSTEELEQCFFAALLHDIGALSLEDKIELRNFEVTDVENHCIIGSRFLKKYTWLEDAGTIVRYHHKEWQEWNDTIENPRVFASQILFLADFIERKINRDIHILNQSELIYEEFNKNSGTKFHPQIIDLFLTASNREEFWMDLVSPRLYSILLNEGPFRKIETELSEILKISELFRDIIDFRSHFTSTHSSGVAACSAILSKIFGLTEFEVELMKVAGNIHDLGKLVIPNSILEKPGALTKEERNIMKSHTYYTYAIINSIKGLNNIAEWGAYHHERLDGSGYPFHCTEQNMGINARIIMVADVFTALTEDRPYRKAMSRKEICEIIESFSEKDLMDRKIINMLFENYDEIHSHVAEQQQITREYYEREIYNINSNGE